MDVRQVGTEAEHAGGRRDPGGIRGILFDKDGTLIDYARSWGPLNVAAARHAAAGDPALAERLLAVGGHDPATGSARPDSLLAASPNRVIAAAWVGAGSPFETDRLAADLDALFAAGVDAMVPVTDLAALFARLAGRGLRLGIASSDSEAGIRGLVRRFGLGPHVDFVAGYDSGHGAKPDPGMLLGFCRVTGLDPRQVAVVGDNSHDMEMARAGGAGLRVAVLTGTGTRETLAPAADLCLESVEHLADAL